MLVKITATDQVLEQTMLVKITATDQVLEHFCYLPLKCGEIYSAKHSTQGDVEYHIFFDVIFDEETIVRGVHETRLKVLSKDELREYRINQIIC
jgi:hypothetical protein